MPTQLYAHIIQHTIYHYRHLIGYLFLVIAVTISLAQIKGVQNQNTSRSKADLTLVADLSNVICEARKLSVDTPLVAHARKDLIHVSLQGIPKNGARALTDLQIVVAHGPVARTSSPQQRGGLVKAETRLITDLASQGKKFVNCR